MSGRILLAGTGSGCGKTSVTVGVLAALRRRGLTVSACKCGPDYIDPLFHREVLGLPSRNLDLFLSGEDIVRGLLGRSGDSDVTVIEGVMGFYDGLGGGDTASSCHLSRCTDTPVALVADCSGKALSLVAELQGYVHFAPNRIAGIILNKTTAHTYPMLKQLVEEHCGVPVLGWLPKLPEAALASRHLGLVTAAEVVDLSRRVALLADAMEATVDLDRLLQLAETAPTLAALPPARPVAAVRVAVASDRAFCFTYADTLTLLEELGAEILPFSPLTDQRLPDNIHGLLLGGGYPELYAGQLAANAGLLAQLRDRVSGGLPTIAECGGFMLLCRQLVTDGGSYPMAGAIDATVTMGTKLSRFGYCTMTARRDNLLCKAGESLTAHEFHYSTADSPGNSFRAEKASGAAWDSGYATATLYAGYPHLYLPGNPAAAERFIRQCAAYKEGTP